MLDRHARHQEPIKADALFRPLSRLRRGCEPFLDFADHVGGEGEAEAEERLVEFFSVDEAGAVAVESEKDAVPVLRGESKYRHEVRDKEDRAGI